MTSDEPFIKVQNLWFTYPDGTLALQGISLDIHKGEFIAMIGQNGSGKTTLAKQLPALLKPTKGQVQVGDCDTKVSSPTVLCRKVGYVFQNPDYMIVKATVEEEVAFGPKTAKLPQAEVKKRVDKYLKLMELEGFRTTHPIFLSRAERQRVCIASILAMEPEVIIVDEPTTGMDMRQSYASMENLKKLNENGRTVLFITHNMRLVGEYAKRVIVMGEGKILLDGTPREVFSKPEILRSTFIAPPQITQLAQKCMEYGFPSDIMSVDEMYAAFRATLIRV